MKIGYLRVSLEDQKEDRQVDGLNSVCDEIYVEKISAVHQERPVYEKVIAMLQPGDTLVVWDLDRAFRDVLDALLQIKKFNERGVFFNVLASPMDTTTDEGEWAYIVSAANAQLERKRLITRTKQGMAAAKRRGVHIGRPYKLSKRQVWRAYTLITAGKFTMRAMANTLGCSVDTLTRSFKRLELVV